MIKMALRRCSGSFSLTLNWVVPPHPHPPIPKKRKATKVTLVWCKSFLRCLLKTPTLLWLFPLTEKKRVSLKMNGGTSHRREGWGDGQLQQPTGPVEEEENKVSELLSVSEDSARTEDMEDEEDVEFCWEPLVTAAPVLWITKKNQTVRLETLSKTSSVFWC